MSDNTHAAMCVYCGEAIIYDTREVTDMAAAHAKIVEHDQQCDKNPLVARIEFLNQQNTEQQEQNDALAMKAERLTAALNYSCEYLNSNHLNTIGHKSKAHMEMISAIEETAPLEQEEFSVCPDCEGDGNIACVTCPICDGVGTLSMEESARLHAARRAEQVNNCELECGAYGTYCKCAAEGHQ